MKQLQDIHETPIEGVTLKPTDTISEIEAELKGPEDTPFAGGLFTIVLSFGDQYPQQPPKGYFKTKIFHHPIKIMTTILKRALFPKINLYSMWTRIK